MIKDYRQLNPTLVAVLFLLAGCGEKPGTVDAGTEPDAGLPTVPPSELAIRLSPAFCSHQERCCATQGADCAERAQIALQVFGTILFSELDGGGVELDGTQLNQCLSALSSTACPDLGFILARPECQKMFVGKRNAGEPCVEYIGCTAGLACVVGTCLPVAPAGGSCDGGSPECQNGMCRYRNCALGTACAKGQCRPWPGIGAACRGDAGVECYPATDYCSCSNPATGCAQGGTCARKRAAGEACTVGSQCASLRCTSGTCGAVNYQDLQCQ